MAERVKLKSLTALGFKGFAGSTGGDRAHFYMQSVSELDSRTIRFDDLTIVLGANGSGKSNIALLFQLVRALTDRRLQDFVARHGGADSLLHYGSKTTKTINVHLTFSGQTERYYQCQLHAEQPDTLHVSGEAVGAHESDEVTSHLQRAIQSRESLLDEPPAGTEPMVVLGHTRGLRAFQFHDTSPSARIRKSCYVEDAQELSHDGGNLVAFLHVLRVKHRDHYERIRATIQQVFPSFDDFELKPTPLNERMMLLNWRAKGQPDYLFGPHQISDGTLRFMALATLLLQPTDKLPSMIVIDEPELGLHPSALATLAGLVKQASVHSQIVLATQSPTLVDHFELEQIRVLQQENGASRFLDLDTADLRRWLDDYSLGEIWQKNLLRGGPEHV